MSRATRRAVLLAFAGLFAALFARATAELATGLSWFYPGLVFGVAIAAVFVFHGGVRSPLRLIAFIAASIAAFPISVIAAFEADGLYSSLFGARLDIPLPIVFVAGGLGASVIFFSAWIVFGPAKITWRDIGRPTLASVAGGVLAVIGWIAGGHSSQDPTQSAALNVTWQIGVALFLAFSVPIEERRAAPDAEPARRSIGMKLIAGLFFAALVAFFGWLVHGKVQSARSRARWDAARREMIAEAPSAQSLPSIEATTPEQAVIEEDIGGYFAGNPQVRAVPGDAGSPGFSAPSPSHVNYAELYQRQEQPPFGFGGVMVTVDQYPNPAWARYKAKYEDPNLSIWSPPDVATRFQNRIYMNSAQWSASRGGVLIFRWPSGRAAVTIRYETDRAINDDFLKRYLEKYPSSL